MTPLPSVPNALKVALHWNDVGDVGAMTVFHLSYTGGPPSDGQCATMAGTIGGHAATRFASLLGTHSYVGVATVLDLSSDMGGEGTGGSATVGTNAHAEVGPGDSVVVSKNVARHYRGGHPRSYLPLGTSNDIGSGKWGSSFVSSVDTAWTNFIIDCLASGSGCTITGEISVSYYSGGARRATPVKDIITSYSVSELIGSQRRRNRKQ